LFDAASAKMQPLHSAFAPPGCETVQPHFAPCSVRRIPRVRLFIDYVTQLFRDIEQQRLVRAPAAAMPRWVKAQRPRASANRE
jgi:hypothetical protein